MWPELGTQEAPFQLRHGTMGPKARPAKCFSKCQQLLLSLPNGRGARGMVALVPSFSHIVTGRGRLGDDSSRSFKGYVNWAFGFLNFGASERGFAASFGFSCEPV